MLLYNFHVYILKFVFSRKRKKLNTHYLYIYILLCIYQMNFLSTITSLAVIQWKLNAIIIVYNVTCAKIYFDLFIGVIQILLYTFKKFWKEVDVTLFSWWITYNRNEQKYEQRYEPGYYVNSTFIALIYCVFGMRLVLVSLYLIYDT